MKKMYRIIHHLLIEGNLYLKSYLSGSKLGINALTRDGLCAGGGGGGGFIRGVTQV